jgi:hypothetical protein
MNFRLRYLFYIAIPALLLYGCASYGSLTGGPKDVTPPKLVECIPINGATNFNGKRIVLTFDEFIQLKDQQKQFVVSPPMKKAPSVLANRKDIYISFLDTLLKNTTYTLYFGNSIVDNNEGNPFKKFDFVFSTGNHIDSLYILGKIKNAFDHTNDKDGMYVMLYPSNEDSIPRKKIPLYIAKSDDKGWFKLSHVAPGKYFMFGLKDLNANYRFDMATEQIAFSDSLVTFDSSFLEKPDTTNYIKIAKRDTAHFDSTDYYAGRTPKIELFYFTENVKKQFLNSSSRSQSNKLTFIFELPVLTPDIELLGSYQPKDWYAKEYNRKSDTLEYWITDTTLIKMDTLTLRIGYFKPDSTGKDFLKNDTIKFTVKLNAAQQRQKEKEKKEAEKTANHTENGPGGHGGPGGNSPDQGGTPPQQPEKKSSAKKGLFAKKNETEEKDKKKKTATGPKIDCSLANTPILDLNARVMFQPDQPVSEFNRNKLHLFTIKDSVLYPVKYSIVKDSFHYRKYYLDFKYLEDTQYKLIADSGMFVDLFNRWSDSTGFIFKTQKLEYYGTIKLTLQNVKGPTIVQLTNTSGTVLRQKRVSADGLVLFDYLSQGDYTFKLIYDSNNNGIWDTGSWGQKLQPEKTTFYDQKITVRQNWDSEISWQLKN